MSHTVVRTFALTQVAVAAFMGIFGRRRTDFISDFTYNKYHFAVFVQAASSFGLMQSVKIKQPA